MYFTYRQNCVKCQKQFYQIRNPDKKLLKMRTTFLIKFDTYETNSIIFNNILMHQMKFKKFVAKQNL